MIDPVMLDAGPAGMLAHPRRRADIDTWLNGLLYAGVEVILPEIADYEVRRSLLLAGLQQSTGELDALKRVLTFQPISTPSMMKAAELWADARRQGRPTADLKELDCDVILAAQALEAGAIVATGNVGHLGRYVTATEWWHVVPPSP